VVTGHSKVIQPLTSIQDTHFREEGVKVQAQKLHPSLVLQQPSKRTQMGSRFIRWVRQALERQLLYDEAVARLHLVFVYF